MDSNCFKLEFMFTWKDSLNIDGMGGTICYGQRVRRVVDEWCGQRVKGHVKAWRSGRPANFNMSCPMYLFIYL